jgi:CheY-like chemotaxis protein
LVLATERGDAANWDNIDKIKDVLIVDDNDNNRLILQQIFLLKNIQVHQAKTGMEAVRLISEGHRYDVIFMDYLMPDMDGLETIKKIRKVSSASRQPLRIILLHSSPEDRKLAMACAELKVIHRFVKPIKIHDVYSALTRAYAKEKGIRDSIFTEDVKRTNNRFYVLVAEDNEINMLLVRTIIRRIAPNAVVLEAKNGLEAVAHCEKQWPDLIFMDIQMPDMNGYEATARIRDMEKDKYVPIIALTAGNIKGEMERCLAAGMDDFLIKPAIENTLAAAFDKWISHISRE